MGLYLESREPECGCREDQESYHKGCKNEVTGLVHNSMVYENLTSAGCYDVFVANYGDAADPPADPVPHIPGVWDYCAPGAIWDHPFMDMTGVVNGTRAYEFSPDEHITREQYVPLIARTIRTLM